MAGWGDSGQWRTTGDPAGREELAAGLGSEGQEQPQWLQWSLLPLSQKLARVPEVGGSWETWQDFEEVACPDPKYQLTLADLTKQQDPLSK